MAGSVVGAIAGAFVVVQLPDAWLKLVLGGFILALTWIKIPGIERLDRPASQSPASGWRFSA